MNAVGFSPIDGHLYAWSASGAVRINSDYTVTALTTTVATGGTAPASNAGFKAADISSDGVIYYTTGSPANTIFRLDVNPKSATYLSWLPTISLASGPADLAFNPSDPGYFWSATGGTTIVRYNATTGAADHTYTVASVGTSTLWGQYFDSQGYFYVASSGGIFRVDLTNPTSPSLTVTQLTVTGGITLPTSGDGGRVVTLNMDFGDAIVTGDTYKTKLIDDGARNLINSGLVFMGAGVDSESDAKVGLFAVSSG